MYFTILTGKNFKKMYFDQNSTFESYCKNLKGSKISEDSDSEASLLILEIFLQSHHHSPPLILCFSNEMQFYVRCKFLC